MNNLITQAAATPPEKSITIGSVFGFWIVTAKAHSAPQGRFWSVRCICGKESTVRAHYLRHGRSKSCGCRAGIPCVIPHSEDPTIRYIPLTQGKVAIIDTADYERLMQWKWHAIYDPKARRWCACRGAGRKHIFMHRLLINAPNGFDVDHINRDALDNRRSNLRLATRSQNTANSGLSIRNTSGVKGVYWSRTNRRWGACIKLKGHSRHLGTYLRKEDAAEAYKKAAREAYGEFARFS